MKLAGTKPWLQRVGFTLLSFGMAACGGGGSSNNNPPPDPPPAAFRNALTVSPFADILFNAGLSLTDGTLTATSPASLMQLYQAHGGNEVFTRISTERTTSVNGEDRSQSQGVNRASLALNASLPLNPELGLFGTYGDLSCQTPPDFSEYPEITLPGAWETLTVDQMLPAIRDYAELVAQAIVDTGVTVNVWDIGNEVDFGTAGIAPQPLAGSTCDTTEGNTTWYRAPDGVDTAIGQQSVLSLLSMSEADQITWLQQHVWPHTARIMAAAAEGIRRVVPNAKVSTHIGYGHGPDFAVAFYQAMHDGGFGVDEMGFSFYPSSGSKVGGQLAFFQDIVLRVRTAFNKPVFIAEYAYPSAMLTMGPYASWNFEVPGYPISEAGQHDLLRDLVAWGKDNGVSGIRPWAPDLFISHWAPMSMFNVSGATSGSARPSLDAIAQGLSMP